MSVIIISALINEDNKEVSAKVQEKSKLQQVLYIYYLARLGKFSIGALIHSCGKVNIIEPSFAMKLDIYISKTDMDTQKIDNSNMKTCEIIITAF